jgi:hypothetical protein
MEVLRRSRNKIAAIRIKRLKDKTVQARATAESARR